jgi:putative transposase
MRAARDCAQQLLLPASAGICGGTRAFKAARIFTNHPVYGSRRLQVALWREGISNRPPTRPGADEEARAVGGPAEPEHQQAPSRAQGLPVPSRGKTIDQPNQVWAADRSYIAMRQGFLYLVAMIDWATRRVLSWRLSNTLTAGFCVEALGEALARFGKAGTL